MATYLLDTNSFYWAGADPQRLSATASQYIADPANRGLVSAVTPWELAVKLSLGKLPLAGLLEQFVDRVIESLLLDPLPIAISHGLAVAQLPVFRDHKDPFDRMLVAQAISERLPIVSSDPKLARYGVEVIW